MIGGEGFYDRHTGELLSSQETPMSGEMVVPFVADYFHAKELLKKNPGLYAEVRKYSGGPLGVRAPEDSTGSAVNEIFETKKIGNVEKDYPLGYTLRKPDEVIDYLKSSQEKVA